MKKHSKKQNKDLEFLQDWLFHYNPYKELWYAFKRDQKDDYFNGTLTSPICSEDVKHLVKYLTLITKGIVVEP